MSKSFSGTRTFNYTGRQKFLREDLHFMIDRGPPPVALATMSLAEYELPPAAEVLVEVYRQTAWQRFLLGPVAAVAKSTQPYELRLEDLPEADDLLFRVKVSMETPSGRVLVAHADQISPTEKGVDPQEPQPILPVCREDIGQQVWKVTYSPRPRLVVNHRLGNTWREIARNDTFQTLVYPAALRQVLLWAADAADGSEPGDGSPAQQWLTFAAGIPGAPTLDDFGEAKDAWAEEVVDAFCRLRGSMDLFGRLLDARRSES